MTTETFCRSERPICCLPYIAGCGCLMWWGLAMLASIAVAGEEFPRPGEWPCFRGNSALDGRAIGSGKLSEPTIRWAYRFSYDVATLRLRPEGSDPSPKVDGFESLSPDERHAALGLAAAPQGDIAGASRPIEHSVTTTFADVLPDVAGMEKIHFESSFALPTRDGQWQYGPGQLLAWRDGEWQVEWEVEDAGQTFRPSPLVGDFNADGELEIAILPWCDLRIYSARTGQLKQLCEFTKGRSYGFFGVYDFNGDGMSEFLVLSDFAKHFEVLGFRDGELQLFWQDEIELDIAHPQTIVHVLPEPVAELDGDGNCQIVVSVYNRTGDNRWHTEIRDAMTGEVLADLVDQRVQGIVDLTGDGRDELLIAVTHGQHLPPLGTIRVLTWKEGQPQVAWQMDEAAWHSQRAVPALHRHFDAPYTAMARRIGHRDVVVVRHASGTHGRKAVSRAEWHEGELQLGPTLNASRYCEVLGIDDQGHLVVEVECEPLGEPQVDVAGGSVDLIDIRPKPQKSLQPPIVLHPRHEERPLVVVQDTSSSPAWVAIDPPTSDTPPQERFRLAAGTRLAHASPLGKEPLEIRTLHSSHYGPVAADLAGDGRRQLLLAIATPEGAAQLVALDATSTEVVWSREFDRFSAGRPHLNAGGPLLWQAARLTDQNRQDVLITLRRSHMHSEETYALSGETGQTIWHRERQIADRGFGGQPFAIADFNGDGLDDLASFYTHIRYIVDGKTGEDILAEENYWKDIPLSPAYWGQPVAGKFGPEPNETSLLFTTGSRQMVGLVRLDGQLVWSDAYDNAANGFPAIGDFTGDHQLEAIFVGFEDGVRCYRIATGEQLWSLPLASNHNVVSVVSGDLDGDGRDEAVFATGDMVYCLDTDPQTNEGRIKWQIQMPTRVSSPILADVQSPSDTKLCVLVTGQDGRVYCIDQPDP